MIEFLKTNKELLIGFALAAVCCLWIGISSDPEFGDKSIFIKYRPAFRMEFHSPLGESDLTLQDLSIKEQIEEIAFQEFVMRRGQMKSSISDKSYLAFALIQLTITFLMFGIFKIRNSESINNWLVPIQFFINLFITTLGIALLLAFDELYMSLFILLILSVINYLSIVLLMMISAYKKDHHLKSETIHINKKQ